MSHQPSESAENLPPPDQAEEAIAFGKVVTVGVIAILVFAIATWIAFSTMRAREKMLQPNGPDLLPAQIGESQIGLLEQIPYDVSRSLQTTRDEETARLQSWGWVDRKAGIVHMPIEEAMKRMAREHGR